MQAHNRRRHRAAPRREAVMAWLAHELAWSPQPAWWMWQRASERGWAPRTVARARQAVGVEAHRAGGCWWWCLPLERGGQR